MSGKHITRPNNVRFISSAMSFVVAGRRVRTPVVPTGKRSKRAIMQQRSNAVAWLMLVIVLSLPLVSMELVPFYDTSESRYAEIARVMALSGDWITPWFDVDVPFRGKPPLSFWAQALS